MKELNFIGLGVSRSGTTWTWRQLIKHPQICAPEKKEAGVLLKKNINLFMSHYNGCENKLIGEYTPSYFHQGVLYKIKKHFPNARLLLILRNPTDRIFTQYKVRQWQDYGGIKEKFREWFDSNLEFASNNNYVKWLMRWVKNFNKKQLKIDLYDDLIKDSLSYIQGVYKHIGVRHNFVPPEYWVKEKKIYNRYFEKYPVEMSSSDKKFVRKLFKQSILKLEECLGRKTNWL